MPMEHGGIFVITGRFFSMNGVGQVKYVHSNWYVYGICPEQSVNSAMDK